jgi:drug/metabolite transporter (DMT)-like permease
MHLALVFFAVGIVVRFFPNILAGYSQLSQRERENAKANGLPAFASTVFIIMGMLVIGGYLVGGWMDRPELSRTIGILVTLVGVVVLIVFGNIYAKKSMK